MTSSEGQVLPDVDDRRVVVGVVDGQPDALSARRYGMGYCDGTRAEALNAEPGDRVACPVCSRLVAITKSCQVWAHYSLETLANEGVR